MPIRERIVYAVDDKKLDELLKKLNDIEDQTKDVNKNQPNLEPGTKKSIGALDGLKSTIAGLGIAAAVTAGIKSFADLTQEVNKNRKATAQLSGETGKALDGIVVKARATAQTFDKEYNEVLRAANVVSKEFEISWTEAIDQVNEGFIRGNDINGEYLETLTEYSTFIKQAGLDTEGFNQLIQKQITQGIFSDKGIDAVKEAVISLQEMTPATRDAIKAVGLSADEIIKDIRSGTKTYFEAIQEITRKTNELGDQTVRGQVLADIFRGAGEDAGNYVFTLGDVGQAMRELTPEQEKIEELNRRNLESSELLNEQLVNFSENFSGWGQEISIFIQGPATAVLRWINETFDGLQRLENIQNDYRREFERLDPEHLAEKQKLLNDEYRKLDDILSEGARVAREGSFFERIFGEFNPERVEMAKEKIADISTQIEVTKKIEAERLKDENQAKQDALNKKLAREAEERARIAKAAEEQAKKQAEIDKRRDEIEAKPRIESQAGIPDPESFKEVVSRKQDQNDTIRSLETKLSEDIQDINAKNLEQFKETEELKTEIAEEEQEKRKETINAGIDAILEINQSFTDLRIQQIEGQINANELARNREIQLAEETGASVEAINKKYDDANRRLRNKQAQEEKINALFSIGVNTARGIVAALASVPPNVVLSAIIAGIGLTQAAVVAGKQAPQFAEGVIDLQGPGTMKSDSIPAWLSVHESVIPGQETLDYKPALYAIKNRMISPEILNNFVLNPDFSPVIQNDMSGMAELFESMPHNYVQIDENGMTGYYIRKYDSIKYKANKYSMG